MLWWNWSSVCCFLVVYFLPCKRLVDNKFSRDAERTFFWICCSHPCLRKTKFKRVQLAWIPKCLPPNFFFRERFFYFEFFYCSPPFFQKSSTRLRFNCLNIAKRYFDIILTMILGRWSVPSLHVVQFFFWSASRALFYL